LIGRLLGQQPVQQLVQQLGKQPGQHEQGERFYPLQVDAPYRGFNPPNDQNREKLAEYSQRPPGPWSTSQLPASHLANQLPGPCSTYRYRGAPRSSDELLDPRSTYRQLGPLTMNSILGSLPRNLVQCRWPDNSILGPGPDNSARGENSDNSIFGPGPGPDNSIRGETSDNSILGLRPTNYSLGPRPNYSILGNLGPRPPNRQPGPHSNQFQSFKQQYGHLLLLPPSELLGQLSGEQLCPEPGEIVELDPTIEHQIHQEFSELPEFESGSLTDNSNLGSRPRNSDRGPLSNNSILGIRPPRSNLGPRPMNSMQGPRSPNGQLGVDSNHVQSFLQQNFHLLRLLPSKSQAQEEFCPEPGEIVELDPEVEQQIHQEFSDLPEEFFEPEPRNESDFELRRGELLLLNHHITRTL